MISPRIPIARLVAEGVVIIGSILIAFAIDAWWEERLEREDERRYLTSLHQEFLQSLVSAKNTEQLRIGVLAGNESLIKRIQEGAERTTDESLYFDLSLLSMPVGFNPPRSVLDDLVSSGGTQLIRSDELRIALAQYSAGLQRSNVNADGAWSVWEQRIQPFLEGRVPRVDRLRLGAFGLSLGVNDVALEGRDLTEYQGFRDFRRARTTFPFKPSSHEADFEGLFADPVFEDLLAERWLRIENTVRDISALKSMIEKIIELTEAELGMPESI